MNLHE
jgi:hypothetical protein